MTWPIMPVRSGPMRSTKMPLTTRSAAPASSGTATISPLCAASKFRSWAIWMPSGPSITQTMKLMSK